MPITDSTNFQIPSIDGEAQISFEKKIPEDERKKILSKIGNEPSKISGWELLGKIFLALVIGALMSVMLFIVMSAVDMVIGISVSTEGIQIHPLRWVIFLGLGFFVSLLGSIILTFTYSLLYSKKYHNGAKTAGSLLLIGIFLFVAMLVLFSVFKDSTEGPIILFVFYVSFSIFVASLQIEFMANPNYASSALIGNAIGLLMALAIFGVMRNANAQGVDASAQSMLIWFSTLIGFPIIIFGHGLWEIVYHKIYEYGNNPFYIPSVSEIDENILLENIKEEGEKEEINVEL